VVNERRCLTTSFSIRNGRARGGDDRARGRKRGRDGSATARLPKTQSRSDLSKRRRRPARIFAATAGVRPSREAHSDLVEPALSRRRANAERCFTVTATQPELRRAGPEVAWRLDRKSLEPRGLTGGGFDKGVKEANNLGRRRWAPRRHFGDSYSSATSGSGSKRGGRGALRAVPGPGGVGPADPPRAQKGGGLVQNGSTDSMEVTFP
jgi:hypothetical protein